MHPFALHRMQVVRKEEKEHRLKSFIDKLLQNLSPHAPKNLQLTVLARACDSPVLKALISEKERLQILSPEIRIVVVQREPEASEELKLFLRDVNFRIGCDSRLLDAHEQLTIGQDYSWIGDCMRREPSKRDAYECYSENCQETSAYARRSFERLWHFSHLILPDSITPWKDTKYIPNELDLTLIESLEDGASPIVYTRH